MATWQTFNAADLPLVTTLQETLNGIEPVLEGMITAANLASGALGTVSEFLDNIGDPTAGIRATINALIQDLIENRVGTLIIRPQLLVNTRNRGLDGFGRILEDSLADLCDLQRPQFEVGDTVTGFVALVAAPSFLEIHHLVELFQRLFGEGWKELIDLARALPGAIFPPRRVNGSGFVTAIPAGADARTTFSDSTKLRPKGSDFYSGRRIQMLTGRNSGLVSMVGDFDPLSGTYTMTSAFPGECRVGDAYLTLFNRPGRPPDWRSVRLIDVFPPLAAVTEALAKIRDSIGPQTNALMVIQQIVDILNRKIALLQAIAALIQELIELLNSLSEVTNVNLLPIPPTILGNQGFVQAFRDAANKPQIANNSIVAGVAVMGGGIALAAPLAAIFGPIFEDV